MPYFCLCLPQLMSRPRLETGNIAGPKVLLWGDLHAGHLIPGFMEVRKARPIRIYGESFSDCPPTRVRAESARQHCSEEIATIERRVAQLQPDIAVLASYWPYHDRLEGLAEPLNFLHRLGVPRIVVVGYVPRWLKPLRKSYYGRISEIRHSRFLKDFRISLDQFCGREDRP